MDKRRERFGLMFPSNEFVELFSIGEVVMGSFSLYRIQENISQ